MASWQAQPPSPIEVLPSPSKYDNREWLREDALHSREAHGRVAAMAFFVRARHAARLAGGRGYFARFLCEAGRDGLNLATL